MLIIPVIMVLIIIFCIYMVICLVRVTSKRQKQLKLEIDEKKKKYKSDVFASALLVSGLPLAKTSVCQLFVNDQKFIVDAQNQTFQIDVDKIIAAQIKTDVEIQHEVTSSGGKAVAGALLFGNVGATVGARTITKKHRVATTYFLINYTNQEGGTAVLAFEGCPSVIHKALNDRIQHSVQEL